jgi:signal transduction histidine kinase
MPRKTATDNRDTQRIEAQQRHLLALDLHDDIGQLLTAILINLKKLGEAAPPRPEYLRSIAETRKLVEHIFYSIRNFTRGVSPSNGHIPDLDTALAALTADFSARTGIAVRMAGAADLGSLPLMHRAVIYRIVQESLTNVARHSAAARVSIGIVSDRERITVRIADDGAAVGNPGTAGAGVGTGNGCVPGAGKVAGSTNRVPNPAASGGSGLNGLRDRVRLIGGEFRAGLAQGEGMIVSAVLPLNIS